MFFPVFADRSQEEREIEHLTTTITKVRPESPSPPAHLTPASQDFRTCQALIQRIITQPHSFPPDQSRTAHAEKNLQRALAAKVQDLSASFRKKQRVYMDS